MTEYFIRFSESAEWLQNDLKRGYSFSDYAFFATREEALESDFISIGADPESIAQNDNGQWGFSLDGLCGYGPFDSIEEVLESARERGSFGEYSVCGIYEGSYVNDPRIWDGDVFRAYTLVKTFNTQEQEVAVA